MWISRKKYNEMAKELERLKKQEALFDKYLDVYLDKTFEETREKMAKVVREFSEGGNFDETSIMRAIVSSDTTTRTKICKEMGISFKTLRNIVNGERLKPTTKEKIKKYIYNEQGGIKKEFLELINKSILGE